MNPPTNQLPGGSLSGSLPNPYGGNYTGSTTTNDIALPNSVTGAMTNASHTAPSYGTFPGNETLAGAAGQASTASAVSQSPALPPASAYGAASTGAPFNGLPALPAPGGSLAGYSAAPAAGAGTANNNLPGLPAIPSATAGGNSATHTPASSAYQGATTLNGYTPGTTGRSTTYDFSPSGGGSAGTAPTNSSFSLPPNTATAPASDPSWKR